MPSPRQVPRPTYSRTSHLSRMVQNSLLNNERVRVPSTTAVCSLPRHRPGIGPWSNRGLFPRRRRPAQRPAAAQNRLAITVLPAAVVAAGGVGAATVIAAVVIGAGAIGAAV